MKDDNLKPLNIPYPARKIRYSHRVYDILSSTFPYPKIGEGKIRSRKNKLFVETNLNMSFSASGNMVIHEGDLVDEFIINDIFGRKKPKLKKKLQNKNK
jgi:hypothetical protein